MISSPNHTTKRWFQTGEQISYLGVQLIDLQHQILVCVPNSLIFFFALTHTVQTKAKNQNIDQRRQKDFFIICIYIFSLAVITHKRVLHLKFHHSGATRTTIINSDRPYICFKFAWYLSRGNLVNKSLGKCLGIRVLTIASIL